MPEHDSTPSGSNPSASASLADVPRMPDPRVREFTAHSIDGGLALLFVLLLGAGMIAAAAAVFTGGAKAALIVAGILIGLAAFLAMCGLNTVAPGEARVVQLFGRYRGTIRQDGLRWVNPFTSRTAISARVRNHEADGLSLRGNAEEITEKLAVELHARVEAAGVSIIESRFTHLAYAPEIASAMLQRQQAGAVLAARREIVDGAVGMVEAALARIAVGVPPTPLRQWGKDIVELDPERKAAMVSNLLVVLCGDRAPQPVLNTGSLYQ
ncbi:SPFH domain-containing protein [Streptomyces sp. NBC_01483]|uniref:SPFH domain-containing protein n=1 Tax=Streptomyces sp. NBC_01483 TaxID=2903883 RepID=UPI002E30DC38|nr:SPFH domain-containing protein [Streptomyces sp. NBC_01483]